MSSILLIVILIAAMCVSYYTGRMAALDEISKELEDEIENNKITDEEVEKMTKGTD